MIFKEDANTAAVYLRKAVPKMIKHNIVPNPFNFTLWYSYYSKRFPELNSELDYIVSRFETCPPELSEELLLKYIIKKDDTEHKDRDAFQNAIDALLDDLSENINTAAAQSNRFSSALGKNVVDLSSAKLEGSHTQVLGELTYNANSLCQLNDALQVQMSTAQTEIDSLKKQLKETVAQANTDALTGLNNRRFFESIYNQFIEQDGGEKASLVMMDIDKFKVFNDTHGHLMGDQVLKLVGKLLKAECKEPVVPVRFGGEEFALLCLGMDLKKANEIAEKLRVKLSRIALSNKRTGEKISPVTASFGVAFTRNLELLSELIERADKALYQAKENGRNCVQVAM
jgi:diguanylate cyclase